MYCLKCKYKTESYAVQQVITKNNRPMLTGTCNLCGSKKCKFTGKSEGGKLDVHVMIGKLPIPKGGFTPGQYKYVGPYNPLDQQLEYDPKTGEVTKWYVKPYNNKVDEIAAHRDVC